MYHYRLCFRSDFRLVFDSAHLFQFGASRVTQEVEAVMESWMVAI
jgi:hypothetical protein